MSAVFAFTTYGGPEVQQLTERKAPTPGPDEIAIKVRAAGVNPADWKRREGAFGTRGALPVAMGLEAAGVVTAVGDGVDEFAVGDRKSTRLNSSHVAISYAVFCLKKKK